MNRKIILSIIVLALIAGGAYYVYSHWSPKLDLTTVRNYPSTGENIVAFGDSLVEGVGADKGKDFVSLLSQKLELPIVNLGKAGNTTQDGLRRIHEIKQANPKAVILLLGGNDALQKIPERTTFSNLEDLIIKIHDTGAVVILVGVQNGIFKDTYEEQYKKLSERYDTLYIPNVLDGIFGHKELMTDLVHPNNEGYKKIADKIYPYLKELVK